MASHPLQLRASRPRAWLERHALDEARARATLLSTHGLAIWGGWGGTVTRRMIRGVVRRTVVGLCILRGFTLMRAMAYVLL